jgi:hypothetical protein
VRIRMIGESVQGQTAATRDILRSAESAVAAA